MHRINFLSSFSESAGKAAFKKATKQKKKKTEEERDLGVLMWTGPQRPEISVLVTKKNNTVRVKLSWTYKSSLITYENKDLISKYTTHWKSTSSQRNNTAL